MALPFEILTTTDHYTGKFSLLLYGTMKHGKTYSMLSFPKPFVYYCDQNMSTLCNSRGTQYVVHKSWADLTTKILPAIKNGLIEAETICIDSLSSLATSRVMELQAQNIKGYELWAQIANDMTNFVGQLVSVTSPLAKRPYNVVTTCHMRESWEYSESAKGEEIKKFLGYVPDLDGGFRKQVGKKFDTVLLLTAPVEVSPKSERIRKYYVHVDPPTKDYANLEMTLGDGYGGNSNYKRLPAKLDITDQSFYQELLKAWGAKPDQATPATISPPTKATE